MRLPSPNFTNQRLSLAFGLLPTLRSIDWAARLATSQQAQIVSRSHSENPEQIIRWRHLSTSRWTKPNEYLFLFFQTAFGKDNAVFLNFCNIYGQVKDGTVFWERRGFLSENSFLGGCYCEQNGCWPCACSRVEGNMRWFLYRKLGGNQSYHCQYNALLCCQRA